jgi:hypothetical protein
MLDNSEAVEQLDALKFDEASALARKTLDHLAGFDDPDPQLKYESFVERAIAGFVIGHAQLMSTLPKDGSSFQYRDLMAVMGTSLGGSVELRKALADFDEADANPGKYVPVHFLEYFHARTLTDIGDFKAAEAAYNEAIRLGVLHERRVIPMALLYWWHAHFCQLYAWSVNKDGKGDRAKGHALLLAAKNSIDAGKALPGNSKRLAEWFASEENVLAAHLKGYE